MIQKRSLILLSLMISLITAFMLYHIITSMRMLDAPVKKSCELPAQNVACQSKTGSDMILEQLTSPYFLVIP